MSKAQPKQFDMYEIIRRQESEEDAAESEAAFSGPVRPRLCPKCGEPLLPKDGRCLICNPVQEVRGARFATCTKCGGQVLLAPPWQCGLCGRKLRKVQRERAREGVK